MTRLTPEREKEIREHAWSDFGLTVHQELLAEIDALRGEVKNEKESFTAAVRARR